MTASKLLFALVGLVVAGTAVAQFMEITEPAFLVVQPSRPIHLSGGRITMTCVAFGVPMPTITWSSESRGVDDYNQMKADGISVVTTQIADPVTGLDLVVSMLELCDSNFNGTSVLDMFTCTAVNSLSNTGIPTLGVNSATFDLRPQIYEPAVLIYAPTLNRFHYNGGRLSTTCVAYGSPKPQVRFSSSMLGVSDFSMVSDDGINVHNGEVAVGSDVFVVSTLEICAENLAELDMYLTEIECYADNGVDVNDVDAIGVQSAFFTPQPFARIVSFDLEETPNTMLVTVSFMGPFNPDHLGCFLDKLTFVNMFNPTSDEFRSFSPQYPGSCERITITITRASLDTRDYIGFISAGFIQITADGEAAIVTNGDAENSFTPPLGIERIGINAPLLVDTASSRTANHEIQVLGFDFDQNTNQIFIHFDTLVKFSSLTLSALTFTVAPDPTALEQIEHFLTTSRPSSPASGNTLVKTLCLDLSTEDRAVFAALNICTQRDNCYFFSAQNDLVDYNDHPLQSMDPASPLAVSVFRTPASDLGPLYMRVTVEYISCTLEVALSQEEPFILRPDETVTRIECIADGVENINPDIYLNGQAIGEKYKMRNWPSMITVDVSSKGGVVTAGLLGEFRCRVEGERSISHLINNDNPSIYLPNGDSVTVGLYDTIRIPVIYGSVPPINLLNSTVSIGLFNNDGNPSTFEPAVNVLSPYRVELVFSRALLSMTGSYIVRADGPNSNGDSANLRLTVNAPTLTISPSVLTLLQGEEIASLTCNPSNPSIPVVWMRSDMPGAITSNTPRYQFNVGANDLDLLEGTRFICSVRDPEGTDPNNPVVVATATSILRSIDSSLSLYVISSDDRRQVGENEAIIVANRFSENTQLECLGHLRSNTTELMWVILQDGRDVFAPMQDFSNEIYTVTYGDNQASLTIVNTNEPFRGSVKCISRTIGAEAKVFIQGLDETTFMCPSGDRDSMWSIMWGATLAGRLDAQACPEINGKPTSGMALRMCMSDGTWAVMVDTLGCRTEEFGRVEGEAEDVFADSPFLDDSTLSQRLNSLSTSLFNATTPNRGGSLFPQDLNSGLSIIGGFISVIRDADSKPSALQMNLIESFNNLLDANNAEGWRQLQQNERGSEDLLEHAENYGLYLSEALADPTVDTTEYTNEISITKDNIAYNVKRLTSIEEEVFENGEKGGDAYVRVSLPQALLQGQSATGVINVALNNLNDFLPQPNFNENITTVAASLLVSTRIISSGSPPSTFPTGSLVNLQFETVRTPRANNPRVIFWDPTLRNWSMQGIVTFEDQVQKGEIGEYKTFTVEGTSNHLTAFGVAVDIDQTEFNFSIPVYVGCGVVLLAALLSLFALLISCLSDGLRSFFTVAFIVHVSFIFSLMCAFIAFLAGLELALQNRIGCVATAGLLHYFFTAAFTWLLCESLLMMTFKSVANKWSVVFVFLLIGWGLPIIPTAISLGLQHESYGTTTHCWFFFDGEINVGVVLGFIIPKLILVAITIVCIVIGMILNFRFSYSKIQPALKKPFSCMLWFLWVSTIILTLLLGATWVFAMLMVNVYGLDSETLGWVILALCAVLGIYIFIFSVTVLIVNQKIEYENYFAKKGGGYVGDAGRGTGYEMMAQPAQPKTMGAPIVVANPVFGTGGGGEERK